jgi:hypothetical protein
MHVRLFSFLYLVPDESFIRDSSGTAIPPGHRTVEGRSPESNDPFVAKRLSTMRTMYPILRRINAWLGPSLTKIQDSRFIGLNGSTAENIRHNSETFLPGTAIIKTDGDEDSSSNHAYVRQ